MAQLMKIVLLLKIRKKCTDKTLKDVNGETKNLPSNLKYMTEYKKVPLKNAYITVKDHKENFSTHPKC